MQPHSSEGGPPFFASARKRVMPAGNAGPKRMWTPPLETRCCCSGCGGVPVAIGGADIPTIVVERPALIEKVRTAVTDETGQYRILELRPGTYTVTFALTGFNTVRREGVELTTSFTATINGELCGSGTSPRP